MSCTDGTSLSGGAPYASSAPVEVELGASCTLDTVDSLGDGREVGVWEAPGWGQSFSLSASRSESFVVQLQPLSPPSRPLLLTTTTMAPLPPAPPDMLSSGPLVAMQPVRGRQLQATVGSPADLRQDLDDGVGHVVLQEGVYDLTSGMTQMCSDGMLCLYYAVTIEAEVAGTVVLNAARS
ncbi:MAG: hypothetical protein VYD05_00745, partial [Planctomycetota bacterium]|nr:hypothetical protein [Planctomycetota bacterium]